MPTLEKPKINSPPGKKRKTKKNTKLAPKKMRKIRKRCKNNIRTGKLKPWKYFGENHPEI
jgi:hypothetical protein